MEIKHIHCSQNFYWILSGSCDSEVPSLHSQETKTLPKALVTTQRWVCTMIHTQQEIVSCCYRWFLYKSRVSELPTNFLHYPGTEYTHYLFLRRFSRCGLGWLPGQKNCSRMLSSKQCNRSSHGTDWSETLSSLEHSHLFLSYLSTELLISIDTILHSLLWHLSSFLEWCVSSSVWVLRTIRILVTVEHCW